MNDMLYLKIRQEGKIGRYKILSKLGQGGMGTVFKALDTSLDRVVALKVLASQSTDEASILRFIREAKTTAQLSHPGIVTLYNFEELEGTFFLVMDCIEGCSFADFLKKHQEELSFAQINSLMIPILEAMEYAHSKGFVHRDLKPANILLNQSYLPFITDFGLVKAMSEDSVKLSHSGAILGTPAYMPPEQAEGNPDNPVDHRSDIYSLGAIFYEMLTGRPPFSGTIFVLLQQLATSPVPPPQEINPNIPISLSNICLKALAKKKENRYQTVLEMRSEIEKFQDGKIVRLSPEQFGYMVEDTPALHKTILSDRNVSQDQTINYGTAKGALSQPKDHEKEISHQETINYNTHQGISSSKDNSQLETIQNKAYSPEAQTIYESSAPQAAKNSPSATIQRKRKPTQPQVTQIRSASSRKTTAVPSKKRIPSWAMLALGFIVACLIFYPSKKENSEEKSLAQETASLSSEKKSLETSTEQTKDKTLEETISPEEKAEEIALIQAQKEKKKQEELISQTFQAINIPSRSDLEKWALFADFQQKYSGTSWQEEASKQQKQLEENIQKTLDQLRFQLKENFEKGNFTQFTTLLKSDPVWQKQKTLEEVNQENLDIAQIHNEIVGFKEEVYGWQAFLQKWQVFSEKEYPDLIQERSLEEAKRKLDQWREKLKALPVSLSLKKEASTTIEEYLKEVSFYQQIFARYIPKAWLDLKKRKVWTSFVLIDAMEVVGAVEKVGKKGFFVKSYRDYDKQIPYRDLSATTIYKFMKTKFNSEAMFYLGRFMLYHKEWDGAKRYLEISAKGNFRAKALVQLDYLEKTQPSKPVIEKTPSKEEKVEITQKEDKEPERFGVKERLKERFKERFGQDKEPENPRRFENERPRENERKNFEAPHIQDARKAFWQFVQLVQRNDTRAIERELSQKFRGASKSEINFEKSALTSIMKKMLEKKSLRYDKVRAQELDHRKMRVGFEGYMYFFLMNERHIWKYDGADPSKFRR